jgi:hypothetical protein
MNMEQPHSETDEARPVDGDLSWAQWALRSLAEVVDLHLRTARITATHQMASPVAMSPMPDYALMQVRLARSIRLSIAMSGRIRDEHQERKAAKAAKAAAPEPVVAAPETTPEPPETPEPRETLAEAETPEFEDLAEESEEGLDREPEPRDWDGTAAVETCEAGESCEVGVTYEVHGAWDDPPEPADPVRPAEDRTCPPDEPADGQASPEPPKPDSS